MACMMPGPPYRNILSGAMRCSQCAVAKPSGASVHGITHVMTQCERVVWQWTPIVPPVSWYTVYMNNAAVDGSDIGVRNAFRFCCEVSLTAMATRVATQTAQASRGVPAIAGLVCSRRLNSRYSLYSCPSHSLSPLLSNSRLRRPTSPRPASPRLSASLPSPFRLLS